MKEVCIKLTGKDGDCSTIVDSDVDADKWRWNFNRGRVERAFSINGVKRKRSLANYIMNGEPGEMFDHIDGNPLNNLRSNLRKVTPQ